MGHIMAEKLPKCSFAEGMKIWQEQRLAETSQQGDHLLPAELGKLVAPGGMAAADESQVEHLASCPHCLAKWAAACREGAADSQPVAADDWYTGGMLEAAASGGEVQRRSLASHCGRFVVRIFPGKGGAGPCMVAIEVTDVGSKNEVEGSQVTLRDNNGEELIQGKIVAGRLARMVDNVSDFDLHCWSLRVQRLDMTDHEDE